MFSSRGGGHGGRGGGGGGSGGGSAAVAKLLENNSITCHYEVGRYVGSGGPEGVWRLHEARARSDGKVSVGFEKLWERWPKMIGVHPVRYASCNFQYFKAYGLPRTCTRAEINVCKM